MIKLSYLITVHNENKTLSNLLERLIKYIQDEDEIIILDDFSDNEKTKEILSKYSQLNNVKIYQHALNRNYGEHKNYGNKLCKNEWIFQIDADELPTEILLLNIKSIIEENPEIEIYFIPRINDFRGVSYKDAMTWGWKLTPSPSCNGRLIVNWPDYQGRLYKNIPERIKWMRRLHEKIEGYNKFTVIPSDTEDLALYHDKTIEEQIKTNKLYNELFTEEENRGHALFL